jgi:hypothetical protein
MNDVGSIYVLRVGGINWTGHEPFLKSTTSIYYKHEKVATPEFSPSELNLKALSLFNIKTLNKKSHI